MGVSTSPAAPSTTSYAHTSFAASNSALVTPSSVVTSVMALRGLMRTWSAASSPTRRCVDVNATMVGVLSSSRLLRTIFADTALVTAVAATTALDVPMSIPQCNAAMAR
jgi:hypothetical protein